MLNFTICNKPRDSQKMSIPQITTNSQYGYIVSPMNCVLNCIDEMRIEALIKAGKCI